MSVENSADRSCARHDDAQPLINVVCVIVCYRPVISTLIRLCEHILADGAKVILVDNTEQPYLVAGRLPTGCSLVALAYNSGIAHAQNIGVEKALEAGAAIVVFFDQDSTIGVGFLRTLVAPLDPRLPKITSPQYIDDESNAVLPSLRLNRCGLTRAIHETSAQGPYPVDIVISSGTAATKEVFKLAGLFDEAFFIDGVDTEWCLRCRSKGIPIDVVPFATMRHRIGSRSVRVGPFTVHIHSPARCYYQLRNCFQLMRKPHVPHLFALKHMMSVAFSRMLLLFLVEKRSAYLNAYVLAVRDGFNGVVGAKPT